MQYQYINVATTQTISGLFFWNKTEQHKQNNCVCVWLFFCPPDNAIPIKSWFSDPSDTALLNLLPMLDALRWKKMHNKHYTCLYLFNVQRRHVNWVAQDTWPIALKAKSSSSSSRFTADVRSVLSRNLHQHRLWWLAEPRGRRCGFIHQPSSFPLPASILPSIPFLRQPTGPHWASVLRRWGSGGERLTWDEQYGISTAQKLLRREGEPSFFFFLVSFFFFSKTKMEPLCLISSWYWLRAYDGELMYVSQSALADFISPFLTFRRKISKDGFTLLFSSFPPSNTGLCT